MTPKNVQTTFYLYQQHLKFQKTLASIRKIWRELSN